jgi:uncharacterized membrane protein (DUF2068 family)
LLGSRAPTLYAIVAIKAAKAVLLLLLALGVLSLVGANFDARFDRLLRWVGLDPEQRFLAALGDKLQTVTPANLRCFGWGFLLYSALLLLESLGLARRSWWAVWLAIGETALFIPLEVFDLVQHFSWAISALFVLNLLIVLYLVVNRQRLFRHHHAPSTAGAQPGSGFRN